MCVYVRIPIRMGRLGKRRRRRSEKCTGKGTGRGTTTVEVKIRAVWKNEEE